VALSPEKVVNKEQSLLRLTFFIFSWSPHVAQIDTVGMYSVLECQDCPGVANNLTEYIKLHFLPGLQELRLGPINPHLYMWTFY